MRPEYQIPAVVVGLDVNGLGVARSLAHARVPVIAVDTDFDKPSGWTRFARKIKVGALHGPQLIEALVDIAKKSGTRLMLFLTEEQGVRTVSVHRARLEPFYHLALPDDSVLESLMHKGPCHELAQAAGMRVPQSVHITAKEALSKIRALSFPGILKPGRKDPAYGAQVKKGYRVESLNEVEAIYQRIAPVCSDLIYQEWIEGEDHDIFFCLQYVGENGKAVASFTGQKLRCWPPAVGGTASCVSAPEAAAELECLTSTFFQHAGFVGMGSMEYKRDRRDGSFVVVEPTVARTDYQEEVATLNGINIPLAAYCYELDLPLPEMHIVPQRAVWRHSDTDRWSAQMQGHTQPREIFADRKVFDAYWRADDPGPGVAAMAQKGLRRIKKQLRRSKQGAKA